MTPKRPAERFLFQALSTDPGLIALVGAKVGRGQQLQGTEPPYLTYRLLSGIARNALPATINIFTPLVYAVLGTCKGDTIAPALAIQDRVDEVLGNNNGAVTISGVTWQVGPWVKEVELEYDEVLEGVHYIHAGAQYRAWVYRLN